VINNTRLFFDIETAANPTALALMPEPKAPGNLKDPVKIEAAVAEKKADQTAMAALDPDYARVRSIGWAVGDAEPVILIAQVPPPLPFSPDPTAPAPEPIDPVALANAAEARVIMLFWERYALSNGVACGFNILNFDLPFLMRRSMALGISLPRASRPDLRRFVTDPITDLMQIMYGWGAQPYKGLKTVAALYGLPVTAPGVDGSQVANLTDEQLTEYQRSDVLVTRALHARMNGIYFFH
jgi:hypothetical protein